MSIGTTTWDKREGFIAGISSSQNIRSLIFLSRSHTFYTSYKWNNGYTLKLKLNFIENIKVLMFIGIIF